MMGNLRLLMGPPPEAVPLESIILESIDCGSYVREKIEYAVEPGERVRAYLCVPKALSRPAAAVFCHHQHANNFEIGKSEVVGLAGDEDQSYAAELAKLGFVTIAPDAFLFEERNWSRDSGRAAYFELATRLVLSKTLLAKVLHDVSVGIDYLCGRPEVDLDRIGFIGHSYGGRMAIWAPALDERIRASVSHCGCIDYRHSLSREAGIQMEFCVPGIASLLDISDVCAMSSPRALLLSACMDDIWSRGAQDTYEKALAKYDGNSLELKIWKGGHVFTPKMREYAYAFLSRYLKHSTAAAPRIGSRLAAPVGARPRPPKQHQAP